MRGALPGAMPPGSRRRALPNPLPSEPSFSVTTLAIPWESDDVWAVTGSNPDSRRDALARVQDMQTRPPQALWRGRQHVPPKATYFKTDWWNSCQSSRLFKFTASFAADASSIPQALVML